MLDGQKFSGAAEAGLDFVGDQQGSVLAAQFGGLCEIIVIRHIDALALDRLDHEGGDIAPRQRAFEGGEVIEWNGPAVRHQWSEALPERVVPVERKRAKAQTV